MNTSIADRQPGPDDAELDDIEISDEELTALALAADPNVDLGDQAVPLRSDNGFPNLLPEWYMPVPAGRGLHGRGRVGTAGVVIAAILLVNALGLCITYGFLQIG